MRNLAKVSVIPKPRAAAHLLQRTQNGGDYLDLKSGSDEFMENDPGLLEL